MRNLRRLHQRAQTARADVQPDRLSTDVNLLLVDVWLERARLLRRFAFPTAAMGMANVPSEHRCLCANIAGATSHASSSLTCENRKLMLPPGFGNGQTRTPRAGP